jgi:hypothetical protein
MQAAAIASAIGALAMTDLRTVGCGMSASFVVAGWPRHTFRSDSAGRKVLLTVF